MGDIGAEDGLFWLEKLFYVCYASGMETFLVAEQIS